LGLDRLVALVVARSDLSEKASRTYKANHGGSLCSNERKDQTPRTKKIDSRAEMLAAENEPRKKSDGKSGAEKLKNDSLVSRIWL
jgi:hypothetical protein